jgi:DNA-binding response OmpR family regulator
VNRQRIPANPLALDGKRILLVEDDDRLYCLLKNALQDLGCEVFGSSARLVSLWGSASAAHVDAALIDNSDTPPVSALIRQLGKSGIPILLIGACDSSEGSGSHRRCPRLTKPFTEEDLLYGIVEALGTRHTDSLIPEPAMSQVAL